MSAINIYDEHLEGVSGDDSTNSSRLKSVDRPKQSSLLPPPNPPPPLGKFDVNAAPNKARSNKWIAPDPRYPSKPSKGSDVSNSGGKSNGGKRGRDDNDNRGVLGGRDDFGVGVAGHRSNKRMKPSRPPNAREIFGEINESQHPNRIRTREKQISYGKNTLSYDAYTELVPVTSRTITDPWTPDPKANIPNKRWLGMVKAWRKQLHKYDPPEVSKAQKSLTLDHETPTQGKACVGMDAEKAKAASMGLIVTPESIVPSSTMSESGIVPSSLATATDQQSAVEVYEDNDVGDGWFQQNDSDDDDDDLL